jgi:hypothetical protein
MKRILLEQEIVSLVLVFKTDEASKSLQMRFGQKRKAECETFQEWQQLALSERAECSPKEGSSCWPKSPTGMKDRQMVPRGRPKKSAGHFSYVPKQKLTTLVTSKGTWLRRECWARFCEKPKVLLAEAQLAKQFHLTEWGGGCCA